MCPLLISIFLAIIKFCSSELNVSPNGEISFDKVTNEDVRNCFDSFKKFEGTEMVHVHAVQSTQQPSLKFVLKIFHQEVTNQYEIETSAYSKIPDSPYFPKYYGSFTTVDTKAGYIIMQYIDAMDLEYVMHDLACISEFESYKKCLTESMGFIAAELATAIQILHDNNIVHGDIKPENIIITKDGHAMLIDFGHSIKLKSLKTQMKGIIGTYKYVAPEVDLSTKFNLIHFDYQIDWYSYGVTLSHFDKCYLKAKETFYLKRKDILPDILNRVGPQKYSLIESCTEFAPSARVKSLEELKTLEVFQGINWDEMKQRKAQPPARLIECIKAVNAPRKNNEPVENDEPSKKDDPIEQALNLLKHR